ncbi:hypothetical protein N8I77_001739 [Diaporthe amygdali]|uniref:Phosphatidylglycerol/phosphatidylinositol transfer protein n=1 Tax=Phomopsis amygdali TaxID=1214568 RepID=A0AAD9SRI4_PHOAM|nr:uncharacterized protein J7T55_002237 [Diaporthe amygdali]KAJ0109045.1 hypothetical protein J7T55_002237 [Diaporthe amygdali]KAK2614951.1 hypothetical protein N8I77_001739 [Diaporthe amygdali]
MKPSTIITVISGAIASSGTVSLPDEGEDTQDTSINEARPPATDDIPGKNPFSLCRGDHSRDIAEINQIDLIPNPPVKGQDLTVLAAGTLHDAIEKGTAVDIKVKFIGSVVYHHRFDVCDELEKMGQSCPLPAGPVYFNETFPIIKKIPHGNFFVHADAWSGNGAAVTCFDGKLRF